MKLLVVDDEDIIREGIKRTITHFFPDFSIYLASCPEEAVQALSAEDIDFVLTDIIMPGMTGLELMKISRMKHPQIKWVVISAHSEFAYAQEAVRLGARDYLLKPIGKESLVELINIMKEEYEQENELNLETQRLKSNLKFLREAVFQRWASGLDIGNFDMLSITEDFPQFNLIMVKMESDRKIHLEHFIVENVLSELIELHGIGFVVSYDSHSLLGLIALDKDSDMDLLLETLRKHLKTYLKLPFQIMQSNLITEINLVPEEVQRMRKASAIQVYEHLEKGGLQSIEVALQYIRTHFQEELSLEKVASVVFLNPVYFSQLFKQTTGQGFKDYITELRMDQAKQLLQDPRNKLSNIVKRVGYQDMRHFTHVFRKKYGVTPTEYRGNMKSESKVES